MTAAFTVGRQALLIHIHIRGEITYTCFSPFYADCYVLKKRGGSQGFQCFSSVPVLHYVQAVLFFLLKFEQLS